MLVQLKSDWFAPGGVYYTKGTVEYNGDEDDLPSTAVVVSKTGTLPVKANTPKAGFGAKPLEEQVLDMIPNAGETHMVSTPGGDDDIDLSDDEKAERQAEANATRGEERKEAAKDDAAEAKAAQKDVDKHVKQAEKAADTIAKATDPLDPFKGKK